MGLTSEYTVYAYDCAVITELLDRACTLTILIQANILKINIFQLARNTLISFPPSLPSLNQSLCLTVYHVVQAHILRLFAYYCTVCPYQVVKLIAMQCLFILKSIHSGNIAQFVDLIVTELPI